MNKILALCGLIVGLVISLFMIKIDNTYKPRHVSSFTGGYDKTIKLKRKKKVIDYMENAAYFKEKNFTSAINNIISNKIQSSIITYDDIKNKLPYRSMKYFIRKSLHIGQLKLLISEIQYLTDELVKKGLKHTDKIYFVYAGSAPGHHTSILEGLFPNAEFLLVDPREHCLYYANNKTQYDKEHTSKFLYYKVASGNRFDIPDRNIDCILDGNVEIIDRNNQSDVHDTNKRFSIQNMKETLFQSNYKFYLFEDYYSDDISKVIEYVMQKLNKQIYFCSDIRSSDDEDYPKDLDVVWNLAQQYNWLRNMKNSVCKAMLKFRVPYYTDEDKQHFKRNMNNNIYKHDFNSCSKLGLDFIKNYNSGIFQYYEYESINLQAFPGYTSAESRLIVDGSTIRSNKLVKYNINDYEQKFFYYNNVMRLYGFCVHNEHYISKKLGLDYCNDCAIVINVLQKYFDNFGKANSPRDITNYIEYILNVIRRDLRQSSFHGNFFTFYNNLSDVINDQRAIVISNLYYSNKNVFKNISDKLSAVSSSNRQNDNNGKIYNPYKIKNTLLNVMKKYLSESCIDDIYDKILYFYIFKSYGNDIFNILMTELMLVSWNENICDIQNYSKLIDDINDIKEDVNYYPIKLIKDNKLLIQTDNEKLLLKTNIPENYKITSEMIEYNYFDVRDKLIKVEGPIIGKIYNVRKHKNIYEITSTLLNNNISMLSVPKNVTKNLVLYGNNTNNNLTNGAGINNIYNFTYIDYKEDSIIFNHTPLSFTLLLWWMDYYFPIVITKLNKFTIVLYLYNEYKHIIDDILNKYTIIDYVYMSSNNILIISKQKINDYNY